MDSQRYTAYAKEEQAKFESVCKRCGECCGVSDDPCLNLIRLEDGSYFCKDYPNRLGPQKTVSGKTLTCVPIRDHIGRSTLRNNCAYAPEH